jgi:hypothetical protein
MGYQNRKHFEKWLSTNPSAGQSNYIEDDDAPLIRQMFRKPRSQPCPRPFTGFTTHQRSFPKRL